MTSRQLLKNYLPSAWVEALMALPPREGERIQEVRMRAAEPLTVSMAEGVRYLCPDGLTAVRQSGCFVCSQEQVEACFLAFCHGSVYAHQWDLAQGYIAAEGGIRVGVAGTAVLRDGAVSSVRQVSSLCVRLPRRVAGCGRALLDLVICHNEPISTLLVGPPACGKTTLLRDLAAQLAARRYGVAVVDERGELSLGDSLRGCDVLRGYPKAVGLRQAVRCLAPQVVLFDELGGTAEVEAVADCAHAGVAVIASLHGRDTVEMSRQPFVRELIERHIFSQWVFLQGRHAPGQIRQCYIPEVTLYGVDWCPIDTGSGDGNGLLRIPSSSSSCLVFGDLRPSAADLVAGDDLYRTTPATAVAAVGAE